MEDSPKISVVMAFHNGKAYLRKAVESILNQTFRNFEFIVIDDGSTDGSKEIAEEYAAKDGRVRVISHENRGLTKSLNEGIALARGEFIARMDADDVSHPKRLQIQLDYLKKNPEVVVLGTLVRYISKTGVPLFIRNLPHTHEEIEQCHLTEGGGYIIHPSAMIRAEALQKIGGYDEAFLKAQDYDLWFRLGTVGKLANLPEALLDYRYHEGAITQSARSEQSCCRQEILDRELKKRGMSAALPISSLYSVQLQTSEWLMKAASASGFIRTTFRCGLWIMLKCLYYMARAFLGNR